MSTRYRSAFIFLATMIAGGSLLLSASAHRGLLTLMSVRLTQLSGVALNALGVAVKWDSRTLSTIDGGFVMRVDNDCNGAWAHLIFLASVLAYPATWREKLLGLTVGEPLLFGLNLIRVASLFVVGVYAPSLFRAAHVYLWQFLIIGLAMLLLFIWVDQFVRRPA